MNIKMNHIEGINKGRLVLYALSTCQWCRKVKDLLNELKIDYYYIDVDMADEDELVKLKEEIKKHNPTLSFPTLVIDSKDCIIGFDEKEIRKRLE